MLDGSPEVIDDYYVSGTAQTRHKLHVKLRNLKSGRVTDRVFADSERVTVAELTTREIQFSYLKNGVFTFIDTNNYEELEMDAELVGERKWLLRENDEVKGQILDGQLIDLVFPPAISLKVVETAAPQRGGADTAWKPAKLETGLEITVPLFITPGETLRIDSATRKYLGKDNA